MKRVPYLFVAGTAFSGSTLLSFLLNSHPEVVTLGEMGPDSAVDISRFRCSCGAPLLRCPFYLELQRRVRATGTAFSLGDWQVRFVLGDRRVSDIAMARSLRVRSLEVLRDALVNLWPPTRRRREQISGRVESVARAALESTGARLFVDSSKDPIRVRFLRQNPALDLYVVHLVRDVRGVVASQLRRRPEKSVSWAARRWVRAHSTALRVRGDRGSEEWLRLSYQDLCDEPQKAIDRVVAMVGLDTSPLPSNFTNQEHHLIGNAMRLTTTGQVRADGSWRHRLDEAALATIHRIAGRTSHALGLPMAPWGS